MTMAPRTTTVDAEALYSVVGIEYFPSYLLLPYHGRSCGGVVVVVGGVVFGLSVILMIEQKYSLP
jgi:hypothetical protein